MSARDLRIKADIDKIEQLNKTTSGGVVLKSVTKDRLLIDLKYKTVANSSGNIINSSTVEIQLGSKYPFAEPKVIFKTNVFHPNVYGSGQVCLGTKWMPTEGLNLLVERLVKLVIYDASILNLSSPANTEASSWYSRTVNRDHSMFPTDTFVKKAEKKKPTIKWNDNSNEPEYTIKECPNCGAKIRLKTGKKGKVKCPKCSVSSVLET